MPQIPDQDRYIKGLVKAKAPGAQIEGPIDATPSRRITIKSVVDGLVDHIPPLRRILRRNSNPQS